MQLDLRDEEAYDTTNVEHVDQKTQVLRTHGVVGVGFGEELSPE